MSLLSILAVFFASVIASAFVTKPFQAVLRRWVQRYTPPANPQKNLQGLLVACAVVDTTPGRPGPTNLGLEKKLLQRVGVHGATPLLLPPEMIEAFAKDPDVLGMPGEIALVLCIEVTEELVDNTSKGWTDEFAEWLAREYPKAMPSWERRSGHAIRPKDLLRAYEVTIETVYQKYRLASGGRGPYPTFRRTLGHVYFLTNRSQPIAGWRHSDAILPPGQFWDLVIEHALVEVRVRRGRSSSHVRCGRSKWIEIPHAAASQTSEPAVKA